MACGGGNHVAGNADGDNGEGVNGDVGDGDASRLGCGEVDVVVAGSGLAYEPHRAGKPPDQPGRQRDLLVHEHRGVLPHRGGDDRVVVGCVLPHRGGRAGVGGAGRRLPLQ